MLPVLGNSRLMVAGTAGDSGKTLVSLGLLAAWRAAGLEPAPFKKGPDYIDAAWLGLAAGRVCRNLDTFLQPTARVLGSFVSHASPGLSLIEGNRGLLDGLDVAGTHSTAALAKLLEAPVLLVVNAAKVTRTVAAWVLGCRQLEPDLKLLGVVLNRVAGTRHLREASRAVEELGGVPVLGCLPRLDKNLLPDRHLGLLPPDEHTTPQAVIEELAELCRAHLDLPLILHGARQASPLAPVISSDAAPPSVSRGPIRIGVFRDSAFSFYYPENLEALETAGATLSLLSALETQQLPELDALYIGGGFPETHAARLAGNTALQGSLREAAARGLPIYAECGGLIYLSRGICLEGRTYAMAGVLPVQLEMCCRPQGHGYVELEVDTANPLFPVGTELRGHEFHYTRLDASELPPTAFKVRRGTGCGSGRDGLVHGNVIASYTHLHALGVTEWAPALVRLADCVRHKAPRSC